MQITLVFFLLSRILVHSLLLIFNYFSLSAPFCTQLHCGALTTKYIKTKKVHRVLEQFTVTARGTSTIIYTISSSSSTSFSFYDSLYSTLVSTLLFFLLSIPPGSRLFVFFLPSLFTFSTHIWSMWLTHQSILISQTRECGQKVAQSEFLSLSGLLVARTHQLLTPIRLHLWPLCVRWVKVISWLESEKNNFFLETLTCFRFSSASPFSQEYILILSSLPPPLSRWLFLTFVWAKKESYEEKGNVGWERNVDLGWF